MIHRLFILSTLLILFSCTTKEEKVKDFVEKEVVQQAEDYLICHAILKYVKTNVNEVFTNRINFYAEKPYYDFSYIEKEFYGSFGALVSGGVKKAFDERWNESIQLYTMLSCEENIEYGMHQIDSTLKFRDLIKVTSIYTIDEIADIYFKPNHMKFTDITPELYWEIYRSILCLGAKTYKYDVVDEIRIKEKEENKWVVDLVYHSGYCMPLEIAYSKEAGLYVSEAPWLPESRGTENDFGIEHEDYSKPMPDGTKELLVINPNTAFTPEEQEAPFHGREVKKQVSYDLNGDGKNEIIEYSYQSGVRWGDPEVDYKPMLNIYIKWSNGGIMQLDSDDDHWLEFKILSTKTNGVYDLASGIRGVTYRWNGSRYLK